MATAAPVDVASVDFASVAVVFASVFVASDDMEDTMDDMADETADDAEAAGLLRVGC